MLYDYNLLICIFPTLEFKISLYKKLYTFSTGIYDAFFLRLNIGFLVEAHYVDLGYFGFEFTSVCKCT
jgi:hypothetical protein